MVGEIDPELPAAHVVVVEVAHRRAGGLVVGVCEEAVALGLAGLAVKDQAERQHLADAREDVDNLRLGKVVRDVADKDDFGHKKMDTQREIERLRRKIQQFSILADEQRQVDELVDELLGCADPPVSLAAEPPTAPEPSRHLQNLKFEEFNSVLDILPSSTYSKSIQTDTVEIQLIQDEIPTSVAPARPPSPEQQELTKEPTIRMDMSSIEFQTMLRSSADLMLSELNASSSPVISSPVAVDISTLINSQVQNKCVTDMHFANNKIVASYSSSTDSDGLLLLWDLASSMPQVLSYASPITCCTSFNGLTIAGTWSGHVLVWDTRSASTPVLKSITGHSHPIYSLSVVGSGTAHNLITVSTDGMVCSWQLDMLSHPQV